VLDWLLKDDGDDNEDGELCDDDSVLSELRLLGDDWLLPVLDDGDDPLDSLDSLDSLLELDSSADSSAAIRDS
jgi:hypothetical protein